MCAKKATRDLQRKLAFADIIETNRMNKGGRGQNKKSCKFSERNGSVKGKIGY